MSTEPPTLPVAIQPDTRWYGAIGSADRFHMKIAVHDRVVTGVSNHIASGEEWAVSGTLDAAGILHLEERAAGIVMGTWDGGFLAFHAGVGRWRSADGERSEIFGIEPAFHYPETVPLWGEVKIRPEIHQATWADRCVSETVVPRFVGLPDVQRQEQINRSIEQWMGTKPIDGAPTWCTGSDDYRDFDARWIRRPYVQIRLGERSVHSAFAETNACRVIDAESGAIVDLHSLVKNRRRLDAIYNDATRVQRCEGDCPPPGCSTCADQHVPDAATMCLEADAVTVSGPSMLNFDVPRAQFDAVFDTKSRVGKVLFGVGP
jgi:hypothetical protein